MFSGRHAVFDDADTDHFGAADNGKLQHIQKITGDTVGSCGRSDTGRLQASFAQLIEVLVGMPRILLAGILNELAYDVGEKSMAELAAMSRTATRVTPHDGVEAGPTDRRGPRPPPTLRTARRLGALSAL